MAFDATASLKQIMGHMQESGFYSQVDLGEPMEAPTGDRMHGAVYMQRSAVPVVTLGGETVEIYVAIARSYRNALRVPQSDSEVELIQADAQVRERLMEDFTLNASIRNIDIAGEYGEAMRSEWGRVDIGSTIFRAVDIVVPMVVDASATAAP